MGSAAREPARPDRLDSSTFDEYSPDAIDHQLGHLFQYAQYSPTSFLVSKERHLPFLQTHIEGPDVVLLGDSIIAQMETIGGMRDYEPWPPPAMLQSPRFDRIPRVFNAGVGLETIHNVIYRLLGDPARGLTGLAKIFSQREIKVFVVHVGTNHLRRPGFQDGLSTEDTDLLAMLINALMLCSRVKPMILVTGLFYRYDVDRKLVDRANERLSLLAGWIYMSHGKEWVVYLPSNDSINTEDHIPDGVHLSSEGYRAWARSLFPAVHGCLREQEYLDS